MTLSDSLQQRFADQMGQLLGPEFPNAIGLAVSGGGDSMAMLYLAHNWSRDFGISLHICTVDHGLRADSGVEALMVADECAALGWPHSILRWQGWDGAGNLQDHARRARQQLIGAWATDLDHVLFAHTLDDQAETFLMRLKRGSGVDGLAGMPITRQSANFKILRPLLGEGRAELRHFLTVLQGKWVDDPSNEDTRFERVKMRELVAVLTDYGIDAQILGDTAGRMGRARVALDRRATDVATEYVQQTSYGDILLDRDGFAQAERDTQLRIFAAALMWVSSAEYRPRAAPLGNLLDRLLAGGGGTLHGCDCRAGTLQIRITREFKAVKDLVTVFDADYAQTWDMRWRVALHDAQHTVRALGEQGVAQIEQSRREKTPHIVASAQGLPRHVRRALPGVFVGETLISCAALGFGGGNDAKPAVELCPKPKTFAKLLSKH